MNVSPAQLSAAARRRALVLAAAALVAAGGVVAAALVIWPLLFPPAPTTPAEPPPPPDRLDAPTLPAYIMNMAGGDIDAHAADPADPMGPPVIADQGAYLEVSVRAELEVKHKVHVRLFWRKGDRMQRWRPSGQFGPFSTYRYRGTGEVPFGKGKGDIVVIVSPFPDVPDDVHVSWLRRPPRHWQIMRQPVVWR